MEPSRIRLGRRSFLSACAGESVGYATWIASARALEQDREQNQDVGWHDVSRWGVEGKGWTETERFYDRLPVKAKGVVRDPVWNLSRHSAGMLIRFRSDSTSIRIRYTLLSDSLALPHMPATGVSGVDLYGELGGRWRWIAVSRPAARQVEAELINGLAPGLRSYTMYLPLYNGIEQLEIGVAPTAKFEPVAPRRDPPIVFYGTSIMHGACASRPGMSQPAILGRRLSRPVINLGFSGNGRMDSELGDLLTEIDATAYVIDCLPNMNAELIRERAEAFVTKLRAARPKVPIVLVEDRTFTNSVFLPATQQRHRESRAELRQAYVRLIDSGMKGLLYVDGDRLLGDDGEAAVDGSHPSDLGMVRYCEALDPVLRKALAL